MSSKDANKCQFNVRISERAMEFIKEQTQGFISQKAYLMSLLNREGYEIKEDDF
jgi:hypothetical protein